MITELDAGEDMLACSFICFETLSQDLAFRQQQGGHACSTGSTFAFALGGRVEGLDKSSQASDDSEVKIPAVAKI